MIVTDGVGMSVLWSGKLSGLSTAVVFGTWLLWVMKVVDRGTEEMAVARGMVDGNSLDR